MNSEMRIKDKNEFNDVLKTGKKKISKYFVIYYKDRVKENSRYGITFSKKFGKAIERNYYKRIMREIIRHNQKKFSNLLDYIIIMRGECKKLDYNVLQDNLIDLIKKENL